VKNSEIVLSSGELHTTNIPGENTHSRVKIIRRYQNRKLNDTQESCYVTFIDVAEMIRSGMDLTIINKETNQDITAKTFTQIIFEAEIRASVFLPLKTLK